jgi:tetrahydromethanopterin S-methyltransferase subunit B
MIIIAALIGFAISSLIFIHRESQPIEERNNQLHTMVSELEIAIAELEYAIDAMQNFLDPDVETNLEVIAEIARRMGYVLHGETRLPDPGSGNRQDP